ncbi:tetratricopeptide repeat protein [Draconibacterium sediminis]|uniref:Tetratricopeptide repeat protein n=1 Tax=Draconibacterium sediminis TaxID=1544798 RepID=A0A0D8JC20_9BACT|nr:hypothetical protein [Draconibacterium sediminis]KJF44259.1 hypothetical protein LH29_01710 [Draconibacterium sediminis]
MKKNIFIFLLLCINLQLYSQSQARGSAAIEKIIAPDYNLAKAKLDSCIKYDHSFYKIPECIEDFVEMYPDSAYGYYMKGLNYRSWDGEKAFDNLSMALEKDPTNASIYFERAKLIYNSKFSFAGGGKPLTDKMPIAISDFKKYGDFDKKNLIHSYEYLTSIYKDSGDFERSIDYAEKLIIVYKELSPDKVYIPYSIKADVYAAFEMYEKALEFYDKTIENDHSCLAYLKKAEFLFENQKFEEVLRTLPDRCLASIINSEYHFDTYDALYMKSRCLLETDGDLEIAKYYIKKKISYVNKISPDTYELEKYYRLSAIINYRLKNYIELLKDLDRLAVVYPEIRSDYNYRVWVLETKYSLEDYMGCLKEANELIPSYPNESELYKYKGLSLYFLNDNFGTIRAFDKAISISPEDGYLYRIRGLAKYNTNDKYKAHSDWSKAGEFGDYKSYELMKEYPLN